MARWPQHRKEFTGRNLERDVAQNFGGAVAQADLARFERNWVQWHRNPLCSKHRAACTVARERSTKQWGKHVPRPATATTTTTASAPIAAQRQVCGQKCAARTGRYRCAWRLALSGRQQNSRGQRRRCGDKTTHKAGQNAACPQRHHHAPNGAGTRRTQALHGSFEKSVYPLQRCQTRTQRPRQAPHRTVPYRTA